MPGAPLRSGESAYIFVSFEVGFEVSTCDDLGRAMGAEIERRGICSL